MSTPIQNPVGTPNASDLSERVNRAAQSISQHESSLSGAANTMGIVGFIVLVALAIYFHYGYRMIAELLEPQKLVPLGAQMLRDRLPEARQAMVKQVADSAPAWAEQISLKTRETIPEARGKLEEYVITETDKVLGQVSTVTEDKFRTALRDNREVVEKGIKELAADEKLSEESLNALVVALEGQLQADMQSQSETVLDTLRFLRSRVQRLVAGQGLDEEEKIERRVLMIARRLQLSEADPTPIAAPVIAAPAKTETSEKPEAATGNGSKPEESKPEPTADKFDSEKKPAETDEKPKSETKPADAEKKSE